MQTNVDEADAALIAAQNPWFLHTVNRPATEQQLSPHQGMHTRRSYFFFILTFFICFPFPRLAQSRWNRRQGCCGNQGLAGVLSLTGSIFICPNPF